MIPTAQLKWRQNNSLNTLADASEQVFLACFLTMAEKNIFFSEYEISKNINLNKCEPHNFILCDLLQLH